MLFRRIINYLNIFSFTLLILLPFAYIAGPFLSDLSICLIGLIFLLNLNKKNYKKYLSNYFFYAFLFIYFYFVFTSLISTEVIFSLHSSLFYFRFFLFSIAVWHLLDLFFDYFKYITYALIFLYFLVLIDSYFQFFVGYNIVGYEYNGIRLSGIFGEEYILGSFLSRLMPMLFAFTVISFKNNDKIVYFLSIIFILTDVLIFISGERLAFFYITLTTILFILLVSRWKLIRIITFILSLLIIVFVTLYDDKIKSRMIDNTIQQSNILGDKIIVFTSEHESLYVQSFKIYQDNYIFGIGPRLFRIYCQYPKYVQRFGCSTHSHNTYIQLLVETGVIGFLFFLSIFLLISYYFFKHAYSNFFYKKPIFNDYQIFLLIAVFITLWPLSPSANFFSNSISVIYFYPLGFLLKSFYKD